jgi:hypothetical protein
MSVHSVYYLWATGMMMRGEMIVVVKCRGEEAGHVLLRQTRRSTITIAGLLSMCMMTP